MCLCFFRWNVVTTLVLVMYMYIVLVRGGCLMHKIIRSVTTGLSHVLDPHRIVSLAIVLGRLIMQVDFEKNVPKKRNSNNRPERSPKMKF